MAGGGEKIGGGAERDWQAEAAEDERVFDLERGEGQKRTSDGELANWLAGFAGIPGEEAGRNQMRAEGASGEDNIRAQITDAVRRAEEYRRQNGGEELGKVKAFWVQWKKYLALRYLDAPEAKAECEKVWGEINAVYSKEEIAKFDRMGSYELIRGEIMARRGEIAEKWRKEGVGTGKEWTAQMTTVNAMKGARVSAEKYSEALTLLNRVEISTAFSEMAKADRYYGVVRVPATELGKARPVMEMGEPGRAPRAEKTEGGTTPIEMADEGVTTESAPAPTGMVGEPGLVDMSAEDGPAEGGAESEAAVESASEEGAPRFWEAPERKAIMISVNQDRQAKAVAEEVARMVAKEDLGKTPGKVKRFLKSLFKWGMFGAMNRDITRKRAFETFRKIESGEDVEGERDPVAVAIARAKWDKMEATTQTERFIDAVMENTGKDLLEKGEYIGDIYQVGADESGRKVTKYSRDEAGLTTQTEYREGTEEADVVLSLRDVIAAGARETISEEEFHQRMSEIKGSEAYKKMAGTGINIESYAGIQEAVEELVRGGTEYDAAVERVMNGFSFVNAVAERKIRTHEGLSARQKIYERLRGEKMDGARAKAMGLLFSDTTAKVLTTAGMFAGSVVAGPAFAIAAAGLQGGAAWSERAKRMRGEQEYRMMTGESAEDIAAEAAEIAGSGGRRSRKYAKKVMECLSTQIEKKQSASEWSEGIMGIVNRLRGATETERENVAGELAFVIGQARALRSRNMLTFSSPNQNEIENERAAFARSIAEGVKALREVGVEDESMKIAEAALKNDRIREEFEEMIVLSRGVEEAAGRELDNEVELKNKLARRREAKEYAKGAAISAGITAATIAAGKIIQNLTRPKAETVVETVTEPGRTTSGEVTKVRMDGKSYTEEFGVETPKYVYGKKGETLRFIRGDQGQLYVRGGDSIWISGKHKTIEELVAEGRAVAEISVAPGSTKEIIVELVPIEDGKFGVVTDNISLQELLAAGKVDRVNLSAIAENGTYVRQSAYAPHNYDGSLLTYYTEPTVGEAIASVATTAAKNATRVATPAMPIVAHPSDAVPRDKRGEAVAITEEEAAEAPAEAPEEASAAVAEEAEVTPVASGEAAGVPEGYESMAETDEERFNRVRAIMNEIWSAKSEAEGRRIFEEARLNGRLSREDVDFFTERVRAERG